MIGYSTYVDLFNISRFFILIAVFLCLLETQWQENQNSMVTLLTLLQN